MPNFIRYLLTLCIGCAMTGPLAATTASPNPVWDPLNKRTHEHKFSNGLKLIIREDHRAPIAVFQVWYKVGSSYEPSHLTGISHMLEHMMFKGTHTMPPGSTSKWIAKFGGHENAFTSYDYTAYYQQWSNQYLELSFAIEADRMQGLKLDPTEFSKERNVVFEERRQRTEDNPNSKTYERFLQHALPANAYGQPIIGWMHRIEQLTLNDLYDWYQTWYHPNNALIVVAGDVNPDAVLSLAQRYFGGIPAADLPTISAPKTLESLGKRHIQVTLPAKLPSLYLGFNTPTLQASDNSDTGHSLDPFALYALTALLDSGHSSRMPSQLIRQKKVANHVSAFYSPFRRGDHLLTISATPSAGTSPEKLLTHIWSIINELKKTPPTTQELDRVKAQLYAQLIYQQDSLQHQANQIGQLESLGFHWTDLYLLIEKIEQLSPKTIQAAANTYLNEDNLTLTELIPANIAE